MVKEIIQYPTTPSLEFGANVRHFNQELFDLIDDLKDTIEANHLNALRLSDRLTLCRHCYKKR